MVTFSSTSSAASGYGTCGNKNWAVLSTALPVLPFAMLPLGEGMPVPFPSLLTHEARRRLIWFLIIWQLFLKNIVCFRFLTVVPHLANSLFVLSSVAVGSQRRVELDCSLTYWRITTQFVSRRLWLEKKYHDAWRSMIGSSQHLLKMNYSCVGPQSGSGPYRKGRERSGGLTL